MNSKLLAALVLLLIVAYIISGSSLLLWEPNLSDPSWQSLSEPQGLNIRDVERASSTALGCQVNANRRELIVPNGEGCDFTIKQASLGAGVRTFTLRLSQGALVDDVSLQLVFEEKPLTVEADLQPLGAHQFELYEEGGLLIVPICMQSDDRLPCILKLTTS